MSNCRYLLLRETMISTIYIFVDSVNCNSVSGEKAKIDMHLSEKYVLFSSNKDRRTETESSKSFCFGSLLQKILVFLSS